MYMLQNIVMFILKNGSLFMKIPPKLKKKQQFWPLKCCQQLTLALLARLRCHFLYIHPLILGVSPRQAQSMPIRVRVEGVHLELGSPSCTLHLGWTWCYRASQTFSPLFFQFWPNLKLSVNSKMPTIYSPFWICFLYPYHWEKWLPVI